MWGFYNSRNRNLANTIFDLIINPEIGSLYNQNLNSPRGQDQYFLRDYVYPLVKNDSIVHDSYFCHKLGGDPFPTQRVGNCFIGSRLGCNETGIHFGCPSNCRPKDHQNWTTC